MRPALFLFLCLGLALAGCSDRQRRNPLDPLAGSADLSAIAGLDALAGDGQVLLSWDLTFFEDVSGYHLYRRVGNGAFVRHPQEMLAPETREFADLEVVNGTTYEYRMTLVIEGEGEQGLGGSEQATPGEEVAWVADRMSGLVWKISADGRDAHFAQGRFPSLEGMALDPVDGSCWVSDRFFEGIYRIAEDGELELHYGAVKRAGNLELDATGRRLWLVDQETREVKWMELESAADSLALEVVDASFLAPGDLAAQDGGCWIADAEEGRVLYYHPDGEREEFRGLDRPQGMSAGSRQECWVLAGGGQEVWRLERSGERQGFTLPFAGGVGLAVDQRAARLWVLGSADLAVFDLDGSLERRWTDLVDGRALAVDTLHGHVWIATGEYLWKFTRQGENLSRLGGFSGPLRVAVDPGM